jgi:hypothetical protein
MHCHIQKFLKYTSPLNRRKRKKAISIYTDYPIPSLMLINDWSYFRRRPTFGRVRAACMAAIGDVDEVTVCAEGD